jgi:hypothetical protein
MVGSLLWKLRVFGPSSAMACYVVS